MNFVEGWKSSFLPFSKKKKQEKPCEEETAALQVVAFSLPGPVNHLRKFRMPFATLSKKNVADGVTFQKIFEIFKWSLGVLLGGIWPLHRHDGTEHEDATSYKKAGWSLGLRGVLCEVRCDWSALKQLFDFPMWNESNFCWQCAVTRESYRETHLGAAWRNQLVDHWGFLERMARSGVELNPLFGCPFMNIKLFKPDWLHVCDQGITQRFAASIFWLWMSQQGGTVATKLDAIWAKLQEWYGRNRVQDRLLNLTEKMLKSGKNSYPKLRGSAAVVRNLVPFAHVLCLELQQDSDEVRNATWAAGLFVECYESLREENAQALASLPVNSRKLAALLVVLETLNPARFHVTPKLHLFQHLAESGSLPSRCWTYRDEDFGGSVAAVARRRGGLLSPTATSAVFLEKRFIKTSVSQVVAGDQ